MLNMVELTTLPNPMPPVPATPPTLGEPLLWRGHRIRAIIFDQDGVIADTQHAHKIAWLDWARRNGLDLDEDSFMDRVFGRSNLDVLPEFFPERAADREFIFRMGEDKEEYFLQRLAAGEIPPLPGFHQVVNRALGRSLGLAVGSSAPRRNIELLLARFGVREHFPVTISQADVRASKPAPDIFLACAQGLGLDPAECVVIEDSYHGLHAARAAGCPAIGVTTMHTRQELAPLCEIAVPHFEELLQQDGWRSL